MFAFAHKKNPPGHQWNCGNAWGEDAHRLHLGCWQPSAKHEQLTSCCKLRQRFIHIHLNKPSAPSLSWQIFRTCSRAATASRNILQVYIQHHSTIQLHFIHLHSFLFSTFVRLVGNIHTHTHTYIYNIQ